MQIEREIRRCNMGHKNPFIVQSSLSGDCKMRFLCLAVGFILPLSTLGQSCYSNATDTYDYFSTKTSYFVVDNEDVAPVTMEGECTVQY